MIATLYRVLCDTWFVQVRNCKYPAYRWIIIIPSALWHILVCVTTVKNVPDKYSLLFAIAYVVQTLNAQTGTVSCQGPPTNAWTARTHSALQGLLPPHSQLHFWTVNECLSRTLSYTQSLFLMSIERGGVPGQLCRYSHSLKAGRSGNPIPVGGGGGIFSDPFQKGFGVQAPLFPGVIGFFRGEKGRGGGGRPAAPGRAHPGGGGGGSGNPQGGGGGGGYFPHPFRTVLVSKQPLVQWLSGLSRV